jgi:hypothetical protein
MRKRSKYRPRPVLRNPIQYVKEGLVVTPDEDLNKLRMMELAALEAFRMGQATLAEWHRIKAMMNVAETMARSGIGEEVLSVCMQAQDHLIDAARRFERIGKMGASGPALQCWRDLYEYHDLQRISVPRAEYEKFIQKTHDRERSKAPEVIDLTETK